MLCDNCKKNEATVHIKEIHNGKCISHNLCAVCAHEKEELGDLNGFGFNLADMLFNVNKLSEKLKKQSGENSVNEELYICPICGWSAKKLREANGRLGCPECYHTFSAIVDAALPKVHRGVAHLGKRPVQSAQSSLETKMEELKKLQQELTELVKREEYEAAAVCRDQINALKKSLESFNS